MKNVNLNVISTLKKYFKLPVGLSDHTIGINVAIGASALDISVIEKHLTLDKNLEGPDHPSSLEKNEFKNMVTGIRQVEIALGSNIKKPSKEEISNKSKIRGKLITKTKIKKNEIFSLNNLAIKRSNGGMNAINLLELNGKKSKKIIDQMKNFQNKNYKIALLGAGGHAGVCLDILKIHKKEPICLITPEITKKITSYPKITDKEFLKKFKPNEVKLVNGIGMVPGNNRNLRKDLYKEYTRLDINLLTLCIHQLYFLNRLLFMTLFKSWRVV